MEPFRKSKYIRCTTSLIILVHVCVCHPVPHKHMYTYTDKYDEVKEHAISNVLSMNHIHINVIMEYFEVLVYTKPLYR